MTERNSNMNRRGTERARAITAMKKRKAAKNRHIVITAVSCTLAAIIIAGAAILGTAMIKNHNTQPTAPAVVTKLAMTDPTTQSGTATEAPAQKQAPVQNNNNNNNAVSDNHNDAASDNSTNTQPQAPAAAEAQKNEDKGCSGGVSADGIIYDQRHEIPKNAGTPLHYYANGKTSGGYDWDYDGDNNNFSVCCNYNTANNQYDFIIYGKAEGTAHITLYYYTSDTVKVPVSMTINVDKNLNVTQA